MLVGTSSGHDTSLFYSEIRVIIAACTSPNISPSMFCNLIETMVRSNGNHGYTHMYMAESIKFKASVYMD